MNYRDNLKVKCVNLADESKYIRRLERRRLNAARRAEKQESKNYNYAVFFNLQDHRRREVRQAARSAHLAYGFLKGHSYAMMEEKSWGPPNFAEIERLARKYGELGDNVIKDKFEAWKAEAVEYLKNDDSMPLRMIRHSHRHQMEACRDQIIRMIK